MDLGRVLGALLGGAAQPPRRRRRSTPSVFNSRSGGGQLGRAIGAIAGVAIEAMMRGGQGQSVPAPAPIPVPRPAPRRDAAPWSVPAPPRRVPQAGGSPWSVPTQVPDAEPDAPDAEAAEGLLMIRAMVAAARADGALDAAERRAIAGQLDTAGLSAEERDFVLADFDRPMTVEALAREATDSMLKARLYAAAVVGAGTLTPGERAWLDALARALKLDKAAAASIEARLGE